MHLQKYAQAHLTYLMLFPAEVLPDTTIKGTQTDIGGVQDVPLGGSFDAAITFVAAGGDDGGEDPSGDADDPAGIPPEVVRVGMLFGRA